MPHALSLRENKHRWCWEATGKNQISRDAIAYYHGQIGLDASALHEMAGTAAFHDLKVMQACRATIERLAENAARLRRAAISVPLAMIDPPGAAL